ncbi:FBD-associated F-box protein [Rosa sericea]
MVSMSKPRAGMRDRISALSDALLSHILSFLPTLCAVRTSILSVRWRNMWTSLPNLDFDDVRDSFDVPIGPNDKITFTTFVDRVFLYRDSSKIKKLGLKILYSKDFSRINDWICTAVWRNVVEIDLCLSCQEEDFQFPQSLFMCKTLKVFKLYSNLRTIKYPPPLPGCFPNLKFLHVEFDYPDPDSLKILSTRCPMLEELAIFGSIEFGAVCDINVFAPELKKLRIGVHDLDGNCNFSINAPKLEYIDIEAACLSSYYLENANGLVTASVFNDGVEEEYQPFFLNRLAALLSQITNVNHLSLDICDPCLEVWYHSFYFSNLNQMKLVLRDSHYWEVLALLLKKSPKLVNLTLVDNTIFQNYDEHSLPQWEQPESVPVCLLRNLSSITIKGFRGHQGEMDVAQYMLKNGHVLNKMTIYTDYTGNLYKKEKELYKEFLMFERRSMTCKVEFIKM